MITKDECLKLIKSEPKKYCREKYFKKCFPDFYQEIISTFPENFKFSQKLFHFFYDMKMKEGFCHVCGKRCGFGKFNTGYYKHCCRSCSVLDKEVWERIRQTCREKYGEDSYLKTSEFKEKVKQTCLEKYGNESYFKTSDFREKYKQTCLEKYGEDNYAKTQECHEKMRQTCQEKYGESM